MAQMGLKVLGLRLTAGVRRSHGDGAAILVFTYDTSIWWFAQIRGPII